jgi:hypothetical protein
MVMLAQRAFLMLVLSAALLAACGDPCTDLSKKICKCKPTEIEQQACIQAISDSSRPTATSDQQGVCADIMDGCTCKKLKAGDLAACGLAEE